MPRWSPSQEWAGEDAYVIGGGPSLRNFDWDLLRGKNTIGCNSAFILGVDIVKICIFADFLWWKKIGERGTERYGGRVVGVADELKRETCPWLLTMDRTETQVGLGTKKLGYNGNTGSLALNLALVLGARRVYLLGFDMKLATVDDTPRANWHTLRYEPAKASVYDKFLTGFLDVARELPIKFPGCEVWNVTRDSDLKSFPRVTPEAHFGCPVEMKG